MPSNESETTISQPETQRDPDQEAGSGSGDLLGKPTPQAQYQYLEGATGVDSSKVGGWVREGTSLLPNQVESDQKDQELYERLPRRKRYKLASTE